MADSTRGKKSKLVRQNSIDSTRAAKGAKKAASSKTKKATKRPARGA